MKMVFSEIIVCFGLHFANTLILLTYMKYILRLEFAGSCAEMVPVLLVGSMIGVTMGIFITSIGKTKEGVKIGIMLAFSMTFSFLAGMMNVETKNLIDRHAPFINRINPAALISDVLPECLRRSKALCTGPCHIVRAVRPAGGGYISDCKEETLWQYLKPI